VEVINFGPLGASVDVIGFGHGNSVPLLPASTGTSSTSDQPSYGTGLILQEEISYFRKSRGNVDVVRGEILPAFVQQVREEDGKLNIGLRRYGGKAKSTEVETMIMDRLGMTPKGWLPIGDTSSPADIDREFPGVSKTIFKKALGGLYKRGESTEGRVITN
jgi:predicted RNA-binding protein (virulence factor B family)